MAEKEKKCLSGNIVILPEIEGLYKSAQDYSIDYGASLVKVMYRVSTDDQHTNKCLAVASIPEGKHEDISEFLKNHAKVTVKTKESTSKPIIHTTGLGITHYGKQMEEMLGVMFQNESEMDCYAKAIKHILLTVETCHSFWNIPKAAFEMATRISDGFLNMGKKVKEKGLMENDWSSDTGYISSDSVSMIPVEERYTLYGKQTPLYPCLIAVCGSGLLFFIIKDEKSRAELADYSARSGKTLLGLGSLLTGAKSYNELMSLASKGDTCSIDSYIRDIMVKNEDDWYGLFPHEGLSFCFGKTFQKSISDYSREDLAASFLNMLYDDMSHIAVNIAVANQIHSVLFCGSMLNQEVARYYLAKNFLSKSLMMPKQKQATLHLCKLGGQLGAIGAWMCGMEAENKH